MYITLPGALTKCPL